MSRVRTSRVPRHERRHAHLIDCSSQDEELSFICHHCGRTVLPPEHGTRHRNHCPHCLWSRHVDRVPGDRRSSCRGAMAPIAIWVRDGEWALLHRCERCAMIRSNRIAGDDDLQALQALQRPLASMPMSIANPGDNNEHDQQETTTHER